MHVFCWMLDQRIGTVFMQSEHLQHISKAHWLGSAKKPKYKSSFCFWKDIWVLDTEFSICLQCKPHQRFFFCCCVNLLSKKANKCIFHEVEPFSMVCWLSWTPQCVCVCDWVCVVVVWRGGQGYRLKWEGLRKTKEPNWTVLLKHVKITRHESS